MIPTVPGVYFEPAAPARRPARPLRTDVAGFVGYAARGPLGVAVEVKDWRAFERAFGGAVPWAHLGASVRGFFENGGATCVVARVADPLEAAAAALTLPDAAFETAQQAPPPAPRPTLRLWASHGRERDVDTGRFLRADGRPLRFESPGAWGNRLAVEVSAVSLGVTRSAGDQADPRLPTAVASLAGVAVGSVVRIRANGATLYRRVEAVDAAARALTWDRPLDGLALPASLGIETVELTLRVLLDGQEAERHEGLSLSRAHPRYAPVVLERASAFLDADLVCAGGFPCDPETPGAWQDAATWPEVGPLSLGDGRDGLASVTAAHFLDALAVLETVDVVSVLAAPDLVLRPDTAAAAEPTPAPAPDCAALAPPPAGRVEGLVQTPEGRALAGVEVLLPGVARTETGRDGRFTLAGVPEGRVSLRLSRAGYEPLEATAEARTVPSSLVPTFVLPPLAVPPALALDEVADVQAAMARQGEAGGYRVALLDPPLLDTMPGAAPEAVLDASLEPDVLRTWRARFDTSYAALYTPWVLVEDRETPGGVRAVPPSGYVAGIIARTDRQEGPHRAPANAPLRDVAALARPVGDAEQGVLNPLGINCLRALPGRGIRVYGARTLSSDPAWRYLNVRRLMLLIEESVEEAHGWAVFEPNTAVLRNALAHSVRQLLGEQWRRGALAGSSPEAAYYVTCNEDNNPPDAIASGRVLVEVGVAPAVPYEFLTFRLGRTEETLQITE